MNIHEIVKYWNSKLQVFLYIFKMILNITDNVFYMNNINKVCVA